MASTNFIDGQSPITTSWLNDVNSVIYNLLSSNGTIPATIAQLKQNLSLSGMASQNASSVAITGGNINGAIIGGTTPSAGIFSVLTSNGVFNANGTVIQNYSGLTRRLTPAGGALIREYGDLGIQTSAVSVTQPAVGTSLTFASTVGIYPGFVVTGTSIPANTTVVSVTSNTVTLSAATTAPVISGASLVFTPPVGAVEYGWFYNADMYTSVKDFKDISAGAFFSDTGGLYKWVYSPSAEAGTNIALSSWQTPFTMNLTNGEFTVSNTILQNYSGLTRNLTPIGGAFVREYCDIAPAGGLPLTGNIEIGTSYNASINLATHTWNGRDIADAAWLEKYSDAAPYYKQIWYAVTGAAGTAPAWALSYQLSVADGSAMFGNLTALSTTTPVSISTGASIGTNTPGLSGNLKLKVYDTGVVAWGLGASAATFEYQVGAAGSHSFFINGVNTVKSTPTANWLLAAGTTTVAPLVFTTGVELTTPISGAVEYDGINFYATSSDAVRRMIITNLESVTNITTVGNGVLTMSGLVGGVINRTGPTAIYTDTTDTAVAIIARTGSNVGNHFETTIINGVAFAATIAGGVGVTLSGNTPTVIAASAVKKYIGVVTSATTVTLFGI